MTSFRLELQKNCGKWLHLMKIGSVAIASISAYQKELGNRTLRSNLRLRQIL